MTKSTKSMIKEKFLYVPSRANNVRPLSRRRQHTCFAYVLISLPCGSSRRRPLQDKTQSIANSQNKKYILHSVSTLASPTPAHLIMRACRQCVHESARLPRVICSHAWYSLDCGGRKTADFRSAIYRTHSPRMARATNSCTRKKIFKRMENPLK